MRVVVRGVRITKDPAVIESINPLGVWSPFGPFSMVAIQGDGKILHIKGQVALDSEGNVVGAGDMLLQTRQVLENIQVILKSCGGTMGDILSLTQFVTDITAFARAGDVRRQFFSAPYPVTTTVQVAALYRPELMVEIAAVAEVPHTRFRRADLQQIDTHKS